MELIILERIKKFGEVTTMADEGEFDYFFARPKLDFELITFKDNSREDTISNMKLTCEKLEAISEDMWSKDSVKDALWEWSGEVGRGHILHPMRTTLSAARQSPDPFTLAHILGRDETLSRLSQVTD